MAYIHGYSARENSRLLDQSQILRRLLHEESTYLQGERVLEVGCGVGAQTLALAQDNPATSITSIDICAASLEKARARIMDEGICNVSFLEASAHALPCSESEFDHAFVCFVLEHLNEPIAALREIKRVLKPGGTITLIEGDHGSCFWHPCTEDSRHVWECLIKSQAELGHNSLIGRELYPLLRQAEFEVSYVKPLWVYADAGNPELLDGVVNKIIVPMVETAEQRSLELDLVDSPTWKRGISDMRKSGEAPSGTFFYTWFKALGATQKT